jgi:hypothetical protein
MRTNQDGRPCGYHVVVVEKDRIDVFYKALGEPPTILVNEPRRFQTLRPEGALRLRGQVWDPEGAVKEIAVRLGTEAGRVATQRRRFWIDFEAELAGAGDQNSGFHDIVVTARAGEASHVLSEPYLFLTGRAARFEAAGAAILRGRVERGDKEATVLVNGTEVGRVDAGAERVAIRVPGKVLRALNEVALQGGGGTRIAGVSLEYGGRAYVDQHRLWAWGYGPELRAGTALYLDLGRPGPGVQWTVRGAGRDE